MIHMVEFRAMGCHASIQLETSADGAPLLNQAIEQIAAIEARLTRFDQTSELMRFNAQAGVWVPVSEVLFENIRAARHMALLTDGLVNPLVLPAMIANGYDRSFEKIDAAAATPAIPAADWRKIELRRDLCEVRIPAHSALDLGGIAKGWTAAYIADDLSQYGPCLVDIGGDMVGRGAPSGLDGWPVEIEDPLTNEVFTTLGLVDSSIATSGTDYRRWLDTNGHTHHHIIDPHTGLPAATDVLTVTIIHPHAPAAEAFAKAVMLHGAQDGLNWLNQQWHASGIVFQTDGAVLAASALNILVHERNAQL